MRSPVLLLPLLQLVLVSGGAYARPAPSRAHAHHRSLVARAIVEAGEQAPERRETPVLAGIHACDTDLHARTDAEVRLDRRTGSLAPRRSSYEEEEPEEDESDGESDDEESSSSSSKKTSSKTKSSSNVERTSSSSKFKWSSKTSSSSTKSSSKTKSASTSSSSDMHALPTVTPVAGAPQVLAAPTPAPAAGGLSMPATGGPAGVGTPQSSKKAAQLAAQLAAARQRAIDGSRLAAATAAGPAGASYAAVSDPSMMTGAASSAWLSPAPGAAYLSGQDVVLSWHQATQETPSVQLALCLLANSNDLRAAQAGVVVAGSCGAPMSAEVTPSASGQAGVWEIRFPAPNVPSADSFYVQLTPSSGEAASSAIDSQSATDDVSTSTSTSGWKRQSRSSSASKTASSDDAVPTSSWKSLQREDKKKSSANDEEDEGDEEDWRRRDAGDMPSSALISPAFVLAPLGTDLTAPAAPPAQNSNDEVGSTDKQRPVPLVGIIVPLVVIAVALLGALALCLFRRGRQSAQARRTAELVAETQSRAEARREMAQLRQAASSSALSLSRSHSSSMRSGSSRSVGASYAPRRHFDSLAPPSDAYTPISAQRRFAADRFGPSLAPPVEYRTLASEVGSAVPQRRGTSTSCGSSAAAHDYRAARGCHGCGSDVGSESYEALLSRRPTTLSTQHSDIEIHPTHLHMRLASPQPAHLAAVPASPQPPALPEKPRVPAALQPAVLGVPTGASASTQWTAVSPSSSEATPRTEQRSPLANPFRNPSPSIAAPSPSATSIRAASYGAAEKAPSGRRGGPAGTVSEESVQRAGAAADLYEQLRRALSGGA